MASAKKGNSISLVEERRLRPIYDLLDANNNKKVVQEVDRLLKKQPNFTCAKVLKALALLRLGKTNECLSIITPIFNNTAETKVDENTIHALTICYRELDEPDILCELLVRTSAGEENEDLMTQCFMAQVRICEYQKQYQTAMKLYKIYQKVPYFSWAVMSLLVKTERETDPLATKVSLALAERMMSKMFKENKIESEQEYSLYILILKKQGNYDKLLDIMNGPNGKKISITTGSFHRNVIECLKEKKDPVALISFLEEAITGQPDEWNFYKQYIDDFAKIETDRVRSFLKALNSEPTDRLTSRPVLLSQLHFIKTARDLGLDHQMDISNILTNFWTTFGNKPFFYADIKFALKLVTTKEEIETFLATSKTLIPEPIIYTCVDDVQRKLNYIILTRYFTSKESKSAEEVFDYVQMCVKCYLDARDDQVEVKSESNARDGLPKDDFMVLAAITLMESFWMGSSNSIWKGYFETCPKYQEEIPKIENFKGERGFLLEKFLIESNLNNGQCNSEKTGNLEQDFGGDPLLKQMRDTVKAVSKELSTMDINTSIFAASEEEMPIYLSMAILEFVLERNPNCSQALLLLAKLYMRCGAIGAGADILIDLDLKHTQWESLGYLFLWKLQTSGFYREADRILHKAEKFYTSSQREIAEHVISAYKYGSWEKILEFLEFRDSLTNSLQFALLSVEGKLFGYTMDCYSRNKTLERAQDAELEQISQHFSNFERYSDNRDLTILLTYCDNDKSSLEKFQKLTFDADVERLKVRSLLLSLMTNFVLLPTLDTKKYKTSLTEIEDLLQKLKVLNENDYSVFDVTIPPFEGMWAPIIYRYVSAGYLQILLNILSLNLEMAKEAKDDQIKSLTVQIAESVKTVTENSFTMWKLKIGSLSTRDQVVQDVFMFTETLGFCCILMDTYGTLVEKSQPPGKTKKKKSNKNFDSVHYENFNLLLNVISEVVQKVGNEIASFELIDSSYPKKWPQMTEFWMGKVNNDLHSFILPATLPNIMEKLNQSYEKSMKQMAINIKLTQKYIEELKIQLYLDLYCAGKPQAT